MFWFEFCYLFVFCFCFVFEFEFILMFICIWIWILKSHDILKDNSALCSQEFSKTLESKEEPQKGWLGLRKGQRDNYQ